MGDISFIPVRLHGRIVAGAIMDAEDYPNVSRFRWSLSPKGYVRRTDYSSGRGRTVRLHRQLLGLEIGNPSQVDHINGNPLDNRRENLRIATGSENAQNRGGQKNKTSRFRGVHLHRDGRRWVAQAKTPGRKSGYLGIYESEIEAARVASEFRAKHLPASSDARGEMKWEVAS